VVISEADTGSALTHVRDIRPKFPQDYGDPVPAGPAPISDATIRACAAYMQSDEVWDTLERADRSRVQRLVRPRDLMGDEEFRAMMRQVLTIAGAA
jgi:hypothetical protein